LGWIAKSLYQSRIGGLLLPRPNWIAAMLFYVLYAAGVQIFCVAPAPDAGSAGKAAGHPPRYARRALAPGDQLTVPVPARPGLRATRRRQ
jgi:hypothetical protein